MLEARDVLAPRVVLVRGDDDDDDGGTKALAVIAVESRKRSAALVVFIAAVFTCLKKVTYKICEWAYVCLWLRDE